ncbi:MAG: hypothetical protein ACLUCH_05130 [Lachnospirales bacterium]
MYPNLNAEQARFGHTNQYVASLLGLSRTSYEIKKENATFKIKECQKLCEVYNCKFEYLFDNNIHKTF